MSGDQGIREDMALAETLSLAVPLWMLEVRRLSDERRAKLASAMARIVAHQGDVLLFRPRGRGRQFGDGARQAIDHATRPRHRQEPGRCRDQRCWCWRGGQPSYSPGELFTMLAKGLACAAYQPGGVTWAGRHWCASPGDCGDASHLTAAGHG